MKYAMMQKELIEEYGRFPYRNEALGRRNTPEEDEYMRKRNMKWSKKVELKNLIFK